MSTNQSSLPSDYYGIRPSSTSRPPARPEDVATTTSIIHAMYECISGPAGKPREWDRMRSLCLKETHSIRSGKLPDGSTACKIMDNEEFIRQMDSWLVANGFFEYEVHRIEERFGHIAHVFSTYESKHTPDDPKPFMRGINSYQLLFDGTRWWILNVFWQHESPEFPLPAKYLPRS